MKRIALYVLILSVVVSAAVGIGALLSSQFGRTEARVLSSTLCVTGASILSLACAAAWPRTRLRFLPPIGILLAVAGFALVIVLIWIGEEESVEEAWKTAGSLLVLATAATHASLLGVTRLAPRHAWSLPIALAINALLTVCLVAIVWEAWEDDEVTWRVLGVLSILFAAFTILVPVFQRMGRDEIEAESRLARPDRVFFCPRCGTHLDVPTGPVRCEACGTEAEVRYPSPGASTSADAPPG